MNEQEFQEWQKHIQMLKAEGYYKDDDKKRER